MTVITLDGNAETGTVTITHGGTEGTQRRAAVLDANHVVTTTALVPAGWGDQDPAARWQPASNVVLLGDDEDRVGPGWRRENGHWIEPAPAPDVEPTPVPDGATEYGKVDAVGPPILVTLTRTEEQVSAGRLAGYTPEAGHMVKLTRISGQWIAEDRVLLNP